MKQRLTRLLSTKPDLVHLKYVFCPVVALVLITLGANNFNSAVYATAPSEVCNNAGGCVNRKAGCTSNTGNTCSLIAWTNDHDNNEYAAFYYFNPCNSSPADEVTQTCPFTEGTGMNSANAGDYIVQIAVYNPSGNRLGCLGTTSNGNAVLTTCSSPSGSGGGTGTMFVLGGNNPNGLSAGLLGSRYWMDADYGSGAPAVGLNEISNGAPLSTNTEIASWDSSSIW